MLSNRVSPGVDEAAKVKAEFLDSIAEGKVSVEGISKTHAIQLLGTMLGGYNIQPLISIILPQLLGISVIV